jgi:taurine dioxygenase
MGAVPEMTSVRVEPAAGSLGAYVHGFDIGADLDQEQKNYVRALMRQYHVVCFRGQSITPQQHKTFTVTVFIPRPVARRCT